jgi:hypothetical protein
MNAETASRLRFRWFKLTGKRQAVFGYPQTIRLSTDSKSLISFIPNANERSECGDYGFQIGVNLEPRIFRSSVASGILRNLAVAKIRRSAGSR